jgi:hypothetical protein
MTTTGIRRAKREPVAVVEQPKPDRTWADMKSIRGHRLNRAESELAEARRAVQTAREQMRQRRQAARQAMQQARSYWQDSMALFRSMVISSGEIVSRRKRYQRLIEDAQVQRAQAVRAVHGCRQARQQAKAAQGRVLMRRKDSEKLELLCAPQAVD